MNDPRSQLQAALADLVAYRGDPTSNQPRLDAMSDAFEAFLRARAERSVLELRDSLPTAPDLVAMYLGFAASAIWAALGDDRNDRGFRRAVRSRSGLQALIDATGLDVDADDADEELRRWGQEGHLRPEEIPDVPPSHWWWWLPNEPPRT
jgi:hypothetical protein